MEKDKKEGFKAIFVLGVLALCGIGVYLWNKAKREDAVIKKANESNAAAALAPPPIKQPSGTLAPQPVVENFDWNFNKDIVLVKGSKGTTVKMLQGALNVLFKSGLVVDGNLGTNTENAIKDVYLKTIPIDGISYAGSTTLEKLNKRTSGNLKNVFTV